MKFGLLVRQTRSCSAAVLGLPCHPSSGHLVAYLRDFQMFDIEVPGRPLLHALNELLNVRGNGPCF